MPELVIREIEQMQEQLGCRSGGGFTYALRDGSGLTKIGESGQVRVRIRELQSSNGSRLHLIGLAHDSALEKVLHARYAHLRQHGEWFALGDGNPLPIVRGACVSCRPLPKHESALFELTRMRIREAKSRLARMDDRIRSL